MHYRMRHFTRVELLTVVFVLVLLVILVGALLPVFSKDAAKDRRTNCAGNLKQIGLSCLMYSGDCGGFFPNLHSRDFGSGAAVFGNWQPLGSLQYIADTDNKVWTCPSVINEKSDADCGNYRYIGSGLRDDNNSATLVTLGYDASGNHPKNAWMNAIFIDGHVEGAKPNGNKTVTYKIPGGTKTSSWNRNEW